MCCISYEDIQNTDIGSVSSIPGGILLDIGSEWKSAVSQIISVHVCVAVRWGLSSQAEEKKETVKPDLMNYKPCFL